MNADHAPGRPEDWRAGTSFANRGVVYDPIIVQIHHVPLRRQRFDDVATRQLIKQRRAFFAILFQQPLRLILRQYRQ